NLTPEGIWVVLSGQLQHLSLAGTVWRWHLHIQHDCAPVHKARNQRDNSIYCKMPDYMQIQPKFYQAVVNRKITVGFISP
ncbi:hypothetical protein ATANTOWER_003597, partial [Ataeniobius toweri]|nr:hypothetical protein [Ataeniobius toweri]